MYRLEEVNDFEKFDDFVLNHQYGDILQTKMWANTKEDTWDNKQLYLEKDNKKVGAISILIKDIPIFKNKLFYIPRGMVIDYDNFEEVEEAIKLIKAYGKEIKAFKIIFDPNIEKKEHLELLRLMDNLNVKYKDDDFKMSESQPRFNMVTYLDKEIDEKIKDFDKMTERNIKKANKYTYKIEKLNKDNLDIFYEIMKETGKRDKIGIRKKSYFEKMYDTFSKRDLIDINLISLDVEDTIKVNEKDLKNREKEIKALEKKLDKDNNDNLKTHIKNLEESIKTTEEEQKELREINDKYIPLAVTVILYNKKEAFYIYGGSSSKFRNYGATNKLFIENMKEAKAKGMESFNWGGVSGRVDWKRDKKHGGLYKFKRTWDSKMIENIGQFNIIINKFISGLVKIGIKFKKLLHF